VTLLRDAAKVGTPNSAGRSSQLTTVPWRPRVRWTVARVGERELSSAGSVSEQRNKARRRFEPCRLREHKLLGLNHDYRSYSHKIARLLLACGCAWSYVSVQEIVVIPRIGCGKFRRRAVNSCRLQQGNNFALK